MGYIKDNINLKYGVNVFLNGQQETTGRIKRCLVIFCLTTVQGVPKNDFDRWNGVIRKYEKK